jgi:metallophosphoesterase (TIGR00282 family)
LLKILFIGDIEGRPGRKAVKACLPSLIESEELDLVVANGENAAGGFGITLDIAKELLACGIDVITMGNHTWDNRDIYNVLEHEPRVIRPANYPKGTPGQGYYLAETDKGVLVGVVNMLGQVFLEPLRCPFETADEIVTNLRRKTDLVLLDMHAEATSEKIALGWYLDGRVSAVLGTHTHVTTADERILPQGTGYITDVGMTGPINSVLGINSELVITKFKTKRPVRFEVAEGPVAFNAVLLEVDEFGRTTQIKRIRQDLEN